MPPRDLPSPSLIRPDRVRSTQGGFAFVPNRFLHGGFFASLNHAEKALYLFLVLAADRRGLSYYHHDRICSTLEMTLDEYLVVRDSLMAKDLIAFDGSRFQVLSLPHSPVVQPRPPLLTQHDLEDRDPATYDSCLRVSSASVAEASPAAPSIICRRHFRSPPERPRYLARSIHCGAVTRLRSEAARAPSFATAPSARRPSGHANLRAPSTAGP